MDTATGTVEGGFHVCPELLDQGSSARLGQVSHITVDVDDEELLDAKALPHVAEALSLELLGVDLAAVSSEIDRGVDGISAAVDVDQVVDAVDPVEQLLGGGLVDKAELVDASNALRVDAVGIEEQSGGVEVALGLADASSAKDALEGGLKLKAIGRNGEHGFKG